MSTPNFKTTNARRIYAFDDYTTTLDENDNEVEVLKDSWDWENDKEWVAEALKEEGFSEASETCVKSMDGCAPIAEKSLWLGRKYDNNVVIRVEVFMRGGHYSGANLDWDITIGLESSWNNFSMSEYSSLEDLVDDLADDWEEGSYWGNPGMAKIQRKNFIGYVEHEINKQIDAIEASLATKCEMVLVCTGIFSNGEAVYSKVG
ncbi:MAG: hypothetical protein J6Y37_11440 [Paludibacteraceae bacterium]|nr:hypothetical protein [Paludibacteraceae bacterium]